MPHTGYFPYQFVSAWTQLLFYTRTYVEELDFRLVGSSLIYEAREEAAEHMLKNGYDWLFFLDSDMEPAPDTICRLLKWDVPVASAMAFKRVQPYTPCFYPGIKYDGKKAELRTANDWTEGLAEVDGVGMACCLIRREVLEGTPKPLFFPLPVLAEDLGFCWRAKQAGFRIYVDTSLCCGHVGTETITDKHYKEYRRVYADRNNAR